MFEEEAKERAKKEAKIAEERAEREKAKKGKVFAHVSGGGGGGGGGGSSAAKPPAPPSASAEAAGGVEERYVELGGKWGAEERKRQRREGTLGTHGKCRSPQQQCLLSVA